MPAGESVPTRLVRDDNSGTAEKPDAEKPRAGQASDVTVVAVKSNIAALAAKTGNGTVALAARRDHAAWRGSNGASDRGGEAHAECADG